jgi:hypothetical protein
LIKIKQINYKKFILPKTKQFPYKNKNTVFSFLFLSSLFLFIFQINYISGKPSEQSLVISAELNKNNFISGESIVLSTQATSIIKESDGETKFIPFEGKLKLYIFHLEDFVGDISLTIERGANFTEIPFPLIQSKDFVINSTSHEYIFDAPNKVGRYAIIYETFSDQFSNTTDAKPLYYAYYFTVTYPYLTTWGISFFIALIATLGLIILIILSTKNIEFTIFEVSRFICISGITLPIVFGLLFIDSEWGRNSPISVLKFYDTSNNNDERLGNQWIVNIGGIKINNYQSGIFIPVFVIIFGLIGGYLRYLHRTILQKENVEYLSYIDEYLFNWNDIVGSTYESNKFKQYLNNKFRFPWINDRHFENISPNQLKIESSDKKNIISIVLNETEDKITINHNNILLVELIARKSNDRTLVYTRIPKKNWLFYQSLGDLTILVMAPLLAIAAWFLLTTAGVYDKYIIATVSFAIGLITENIINRLINFSELAFKGK